jgi:signal transduction histidine kinase
MRRAIARSAQLIQANRNKNMALDLLHEAKRISDEANRSKSDFLAFLCHELRNPLHVRAHPHFALYTLTRTFFSAYRRSVCPSTIHTREETPS